jgi:uncharacterized protein YkuJ
MRYRANFDTFSLKKLDKNNKFMFDNIVVDNKFKNL